MSDVDGLAVRALVGTNVLVEVDEEWHVRIELALQCAAGDLLVECVEPQERGRVVEAAHVQLGPGGLEGDATRSVRMITLVQPFMEPTLPTEISAERPRKSAHSSHP